METSGRGTTGLAVRQLEEQAEELLKAGIDRRLIRYSVGIESIDDLIEDFKFAIDD